MDAWSPAPSGRAAYPGGGEAGNGTQNFALDTGRWPLIPFCKQGECKEHFSPTRAVPSTCGRQKTIPYPS